jgi:hypothetical protein
MFRVLKQFNAFNEDGEPQLVKDDLLLAEVPIRGWVRFYGKDADFSLQEEDFVRFTEPIGS